MNIKFEFSIVFDITDGSPDRRQSVGTRLFGNVVSKGTLTPQRTGFVQRRGSLTLKPLF